MATRVADTFLQGLQIGGEMADRWERNKDNRRRRSAEDTATEHQRMLSDALAGVIGDAPSTAPEPRSATPQAPAQAMQAPGMAGQTGVESSPTPQAALAVPAGGAVPTPTPRAPNPAARATEAMPTPASVDTPAQATNYYQRMQEQSAKLAAAGVPMEKVLEFKQAASAELAQRARPYAARAIQALMLAKQGGQAGQAYQTIAAKALEKAYEFLPDNGGIKVGVGPQGSLAVKNVGPDGEMMDGPPMLLDAEAVETFMNQLLNPDGVLAMAEKAAARERAERDEAREDTKVKNDTTRAGAAATTAAASASRARSGAAYDAARIEALTGSGDPNFRMFKDGNKNVTEADYQNFLGVLKSRRAAGEPLVDRVDGNGQAYMQGMKLPGPLADSMRRRAEAAGVLFVDPEKDETAPL